MRRLTLKGYVASYVRELSTMNTCSICKVAKEIDQNHRVIEPLVLHAILSGIPNCFEKKYPDLYIEYSTIISMADTEEKLLITELPDRYAKVIKSYRYECAKQDNADRVKLLMHSKILEEKEKKDISNYRIAKDLNINNGNVNSFIKNRSVHSLTYMDVKRIMEYVEAIQEESRKKSVV